jgi:hypothetical protein
MKRLVSQDGTVQYDITVHGEGIPGSEPVFVETIYRTTRIISDVGADGLRGRGTRVFEARKLGHRQEVVGEAVAIKDSWVDADRDREGNIRSKLYAEASETDKTLIDRYFLTVLAQGDVRINGEIDHTHDLIIGHETLLTNSKFELLAKQQNVRRSRVISTGLPIAWDQFALTRAPPVEPYRYSPKVHYRVVFKEVGTAIHAVKALDKVFSALVDATEGRSRSTFCCFPLIIL